MKSLAAIWLLFKRYPFAYYYARGLVAWFGPFEVDNAAGFPEFLLWLLIEFFKLPVWCVDQVLPAVAPNRTVLLVVGALAGCAIGNAVWIGVLRSNVLVPWCLGGRFVSTDHHQDTKAPRGS